MSKMDGLRAMREARHAEMVARSKTTKAPASATPGPVAPKPAGASPKPQAKAQGAEEAAPAAEALCGHRNMSGRTCTREQGHAAKSHRYS